MMDRAYVKTLLEALINVCRTKETRGIEINFDRKPFNTQVKYKIEVQHGLVFIQGPQFEIFGIDNVLDQLECYYDHGVFKPITLEKFIMENI